MMFFRWLTSQTLRNACTLRKHVRNLVSAQRDILPPPTVANLDRTLADFDQVLRSETDGKRLTEAMQKFETDALKWIKPYPHAGWRENVEVLLVAIGVAMAVRTFFIQPFKIPTGSMQPTLFGVTSDDLLNNPEFKDFQIPTGWERVKEWFEGVSYIHEVAQNDGQLSLVDPNNNGWEVVTPQRKLLIFNLPQKYMLGGVQQSIYAPDLGEETIEQRTLDANNHLTLDPRHFYHKGEDVIKLRVRAGDHLFVDRLTYNFRNPERGEIAVFATGGIRGENHPPPNEFYIKRLCVLPGEHVQIGNDRHLIIDGRRLDQTTPHFEKVYGFDPAQAPRENHYSGHVNGVVQQQFNVTPNAELAPLFPGQDTIYTNGPDSYMVFGDNTCNSSDSRAWGPFPAENVIGKSWFVYWPLTSRFGWGNR